MADSSNSGNVDLFLGDGPLARRALISKNCDWIKNVICRDPVTTAQARHLGLHVVSPEDAELHDHAPLAFSLHYPVRIDSAVISRYRVAYNLHPGFLPWCRGLHSVQWAMWEKVPAGATLHVMTDVIDAGPIVEQTKVHFGDYDTLNAVSERVYEAEKDLFDRFWPRIREGEVLPSRPQPPGGSFHSRMDVVKLIRHVREEANWSRLSGRELVRYLRCWGQAELDCGNARLMLACTEPPPTTDRSQQPGPDMSGDQ